MQVKHLSEENVMLKWWEKYKEERKLKLNKKEKEKAFENFKENYEFVRAHNHLQNKTFRVGFNHFFHWDLERLAGMQKYQALQKMHLKSLANYQIEVYEYDQKFKEPDHIDYRECNAVSRVKDQMENSAGWAFSVVSVMESLVFLETGSLKGLSEQQLLNCCRKNQGIYGGGLELAIQYVIDFGLASEEAVPYTGMDGKSNKFKSVAKAKGIRKIKSGDEMSLKQAVARYGPVCVAVNTAAKEFIYYKEGVYYNPHAEPEELFHAMVIVGYGTMNGLDYWIVRNSWSTEWGNDGYILMARNKNNNSGIASCALQIIY